MSELKDWSLTEMEELVAKARTACDAIDWIDPDEKGSILAGFINPDRTITQADIDRAHELAAIHGWD